MVSDESVLTREFCPRALMRCLPWVVCAMYGCSERRAAHDRHAIERAEAPKVARWVEADITRHRDGLVKLSKRIAPGFELTPERQAQSLRLALHTLLKPPKGIQELYASARTFVAAVKVDGTVICRDSEPDKLKGFRLVQHSKALVEVLEGADFTHEVIEIPNPEDAKNPSVVWLMNVPVRNARTHQVVGALSLGIPLWRYAQRITRQLQLDHSKNTSIVLWAYMFRGDHVYHFGTPPDLDLRVPKAKERSKGLAISAGGYTGEFMQFGRWYGYGVLPLRIFVSDRPVGVVIIRSSML